MEERLADLRTFLREAGVTWDETALEFRAAGCEGGGAGVFAKRPLSVGETVCRMPKSSMLTVRTSVVQDVLIAAEVRRKLAGQRGTHSSRRKYGILTRTVSVLK